jgi:8-oxo-dGTP pyrophosphatase MutT (NUDIX family)
MPQGDERRSGAGIMFVTPDGDALFLKRSKKGDHAGTWAFPGGVVEQNEEIADAARREAIEEVGALPKWDLAPLDRATSEDGVDFTTFGQQVDRFEPAPVTDEHDEYLWAPLANPPAPLHPGVRKLLAKFFEEEAAEPEHVGSGAAGEIERELDATDDLEDLQTQLGAGDDDPELKDYIDGKVPRGELGGLNSDKRIATDSMAFDFESVRSMDSDGRMRVAVANLSKEQIRPYKGREIPGWDEEKKTHALGLDPDKVYNLLCPGEELEKAASSFNGVQILKKHVPVTADDHRKTDIVGTTGTEARYEAPYLRNSLVIWSKEGIDFIESGDQRELSCGYHYAPDMTAGNFRGNPYDGIMREIEGNHVALVEEGRAGPDVIVGDSALDVAQREPRDMKPTRLEAIAVRYTARALNPQLAFDAKVNYGPVFKGLTTANFKSRMPTILSDLKRLLKGKTIAKDATMEHVAGMLDKLEHVNEPKSLDESVSGPQHRAMEAAAHGHSNLGIPSNVGQEFEHADKGKSFGDMLRDWAMSKDWSGGMSEDDFEHLNKMHKDAAMPENALDDKEDDEEKVDVEVEQGEDKEEDEEEKKGEDGEIEQEEGEDRKAKDAKDRHAKDRAKDHKAKDKKDSAMDGKFVTLDEMNKAVEAAVSTANKQNAATAEARAFVRPYVGELSMALDSAEKVHRQAAVSLGIDGAATVHASALPTLIKALGRKAGAEHHESKRVTAHDAAIGEGTMDRWPEAARIGHV